VRYQLYVGNICYVALAKDHDPDVLAIINHIDPFPKGDDGHLDTQNAADAATA